MAAKKAPKKKKAKPRRPRRVVIRRRWMARTAGERRWRLWNHDLDTLLHELVKNPALSDADPVFLVARAAAFADAYHAMQDARRPPDVSADFDH